MITFQINNCFELKENLIKSKRVCRVVQTPMSLLRISVS